jgi:Lactonase, 7-bladed beta-propeller
MKFKKFGKALLMTALSAGIVIGIASCKQSYSVGYLYVTGTQTASTTGQGVISGFKIDHNTGNLTPIAGLPVSTGGANPSRAVLLTGGRFVYVLNRGTTADGGPCSTTDVCSNANITQFSIGGNGVLAPQGTYYTQGNNPFRMIADSAGAHLYVLEHDAPGGTGCSLVFGPAITTCGDITAFNIDPTTGRLSYLLNSQVTSASGAPLPYFPVPASPIDFTLSSNFFLTLSGTQETGDSVFPYAYNNANGQLTVNQNTSQPLNINQGTAIVVAAGVTYVLDNGPNTNSPPTNGQIFAYTLGSNGSLQAQADGYIPDNPTFSYPNYVLAASGKAFVYVLNMGDNTNTVNAQSGIAAFQVTNPFKLVPISGATGATAGTGAGPQCILEDPSNQFIYTANFNSSTVTGLSINQNSGDLTPLSQATKAKDSYALPGPGTWCVVTGRTS